MTFIAIAIAAIVLGVLVALSLTLHHPVVWVATLVWAGLFFIILLPKYQNTQTALAKGQEVIATVKEVRQWDRRITVDSNDFIRKYEIIAEWQNPRTGQPVQFVSDPVEKDPKPYIQNNQVKVKVNLDNPTQYVVDLSFMPK
ncbi:MAG: hypothetical protein IKX14_05705 [Neisseriaceae bacterium]|nr:hypothetical protein [Neisseriaceae bacterium]